MGLALVDGIQLVSESCFSDAFLHHRFNTHKNVIVFIKIVNVIILALNHGF